MSNHLRMERVHQEGRAANVQQEYENGVQRCPSLSTEKGTLSREYVEERR